MAKYKVSDTKLTTKFRLTYVGDYYSYECENCKTRIDVDQDTEIEEFDFCNHCGLKVTEIINNMQEETK